MWATQLGEIATTSRKPATSSIYTVPVLCIYIYIFFLKKKQYNVTYSNAQEAKKLRQGLAEFDTSNSRE